MDIASNLIDYKQTIKSELENIVSVIFLNAQNFSFELYFFFFSTCCDPLPLSKHWMNIFPNWPSPVSVLLGCCVLQFEWRDLILNNASSSVASLSREYWCTDAILHDNLAPMYLTKEYKNNRTRRNKINRLPNIANVTCARIFSRSVFCGGLTLSVIKCSFDSEKQSNTFFKPSLHQVQILIPTSHRLSHLTKQGWKIQEFVLQCY